MNDSFEVRAAVVHQVLEVAVPKRKRWRNPPGGGPKFVLTAHVAGPVITCREDRPSCPGYIVDRRQVCTRCGAQLARGKWDRTHPEGSTVHISFDPRYGKRQHLFWTDPDPYYGSAGYNDTVFPSLVGSDVYGEVHTDCTTAVAISMLRSTLGSPPMRVVAVLRVSTKSQGDGFGLAVQEAAVREWARRHKHRIVRLHKEIGVSGTTEIHMRPLLIDALAMLSAGEADALVVPRLDRLARDLVIQEQLIAVAAGHGAAIRSASEHEDPHLLDSDPQRVLIRQILGAVNAYERAMIKVRLAGGRAAKLAAGGYIGGRPPYGWAAEGGALRPIQSEQAVRRRILAAHRKGATSREIADDLNAAGIPAKMGPTWHPMVVRRVIQYVSKSTAISQSKGRQRGTKEAG